MVALKDKGRERTNDYNMVDIRNEEEQPEDGDEEAAPEPEAPAE